MSLVVGERMVRTDDGMRGIVELVTLPGYELQELRIVYLDRGEKRIAGKRETWTLEVDPPRKLTTSEILRVAYAADWQLRAFDKNEPAQWWKWDGVPEKIHDIDLVNRIAEYLLNRE